MNNDSTILNINHDEEKPSNLKVLLKKCEPENGNETENENEDNANCNTSVCDDNASTATPSTSSEHIK